MTAISRRILTVVAACAIATATALAPLPVAQASSVGGSAGEALVADCLPVGSPECTAAAPGVNSLFGGGGSLFQNFLWWFGPPNPTPPPQTTVFEFFPLTLIPGFLQPLVSWFADINYEVCIAGLTLQIGPYGTVSGKYSFGCA